MVDIDAGRLLRDLRTLRSFGAQGSGVVRPMFSDADMEARQWLRDTMGEAGLDATIDGVGNVFGTSANPGPTLLIGSHSDTQPRGGWLDGALGVIYGIEIARALGANQATSKLAIDTVAWADEEGSYLSCLGSQSFCGVLSPGEEIASANHSGETVEQAIARVGLSDVERIHLNLDRHVGYLEAHIEQGPMLEESGNLIGVVTSIVGIRTLHITFSGQQNHAGTTPMNRRSDAAVALFDYAVTLGERLAELAYPTTVWTFGDATLDPGAESIIAGRAELVLQFRDPNDEVLDRFEHAAVEMAALLTESGSVGVSVIRARDPIPPTKMDGNLQVHIAKAAEGRVPGAWVHMPSAAGHDPMVLSAHMPCAMLFIPSIGGISHDFAENTSDDDIVMGCRVLADAAAATLS